MTISIFVDGKEETVGKVEYLLTFLQWLRKRMPTLCEHYTFKKTPLGDYRLCIMSIINQYKGKECPGLLVLIRDIIQSSWQFDDW
jgi:hypothetical protein